MTHPVTINHLKYVVIDGPIGVGKTTLAKKLAISFGSDLILEGPEDNPFLERFYRDPKGAAFQTQLFFLFQRAKQLQEIKQEDMFQPVRIADYLMEKDRLFAELTLDPEEYKLYLQVYEHVTQNMPVPDLVIYLQAPVSILKKRIAHRGRHFEKTINANYLRLLGESYARFFHDYKDSPLLIVNAEDMNFAENEQDYMQLLGQISKPQRGRQYFNPLSGEL
ncbi:deoxynucleoside kinase [Beggiatoa alba]|nr:deoxynucleoside kinase [Beggiatoa alba]